MLKFYQPVSESVVAELDILEREFSLLVIVGDPIIEIGLSISGAFGVFGDDERDWVVLAQRRRAADSVAHHQRLPRAQKHRHLLVQLRRYQARAAKWRLLVTVKPENSIFI